MPRKKDSGFAELSRAIMDPALALPKEVPAVNHLPNGELTVRGLIELLKGLDPDLGVRFGKGLRDSLPIVGAVTVDGDYEDGMVSMAESQTHVRRRYLRLLWAGPNRMLGWIT